MKIIIDICHLISITLGFVLFTVIGTVSHEFGHILVAKSLGYETTLHYGSMNYSKPDLSEYLNSDRLLITIGGPLQTTLTGMIGLLILFYRKNDIAEYRLKLIDWLAIFLSLFWLREVFNIVWSIIIEIISPNESFFNGDEKQIAEQLNIWNGTVSSILGVIGLVISVFIVFKVVPQKLRFTFILGGFIGGISGYILWMNILGPKILP